MNVQTYFTDCKIKSVNLTFEENQIELLSLIMEDEERQYLQWCNLLDEPADMCVVNFFKVSRKVLADAECYQIGAVLEAGFECYFVLQSIAVSLLTYFECECNDKEARTISKEISNEFIKAINQLHENKIAFLLKGC